MGITNYAETAGAMRAAVGPDTLNRMAEKNALIERETSAWRALAASTDY